MTQKKDAQRQQQPRAAAGWLAIESVTRCPCMKLEKYLGTVSLKLFQRTTLKAFGRMAIESVTRIQRTKYVNTKV